MITKFKQYINENVFTDEFKRLYNLAPESLKEEVDKTKTIEQNPFWHSEIYVYVHIQLVTNRLFNCYHDINLTLAGFFHDLGKTYTTIFNPKKDSWSSPGHEESTIKIIDKYQDWIKQQGGDIELIKYIVINHMRYKELDKMRTAEQVRFMSEEYFPYVQKFSTADHGGNDLICEPIEKHTEILKKIEQFKIREEKNKIISSKFNGGIVMNKYPYLKGSLLGSTLNDFKRSFDNFDEYALSNSSEQIMKDFDNFFLNKYNKMESLNNCTIKEIKSFISKQLKCDINDIRLFGSRINGSWTNKSDLDVVIKDENKIDYPIFYLDYLGLNCEVRFVEDFELSWLKNSI
jgi:predicted nucleotidyltransferase